MQVPMRQHGQAQSTGGAPRLGKAAKTDNSDVQRGLANVGSAVDRIQAQANEHARQESERQAEMRRREAAIKYQEQITAAMYGDQAARAAQQQILSRPPLVEVVVPDDPWSTGSIEEGPDALKTGDVGDFGDTPNQGEEADRTVVVPVPASDQAGPWGGE